MPHVAAIGVGRLLSHQSEQIQGCLLVRRIAIQIRDLNLVIIIKVQ